MISRVIGLALSADAALTLLLTVGSGGWTSYQQRLVATQQGFSRALAISILRRDHRRSRR